MSNSISLLEKKPSSFHKVYKKSHFAPAFFFLPKDRREALKTLYAVCRVLDDAVDESYEDPVGFLAAWRDVFEKAEAQFVKKYGCFDLAEKFLHFAKKYDIPSFAMIHLIDQGVSVDLKHSRFQTPLDTEGYCYGVAGTVGIACLPLFGVPVQEAKEFAIRLGITVQWINSIRDVGVDAKMGRIYLPLDHLDQFEYTTVDLMAGRENPQFFDLMAFEAKIARSHYKRAEELMPQKWKNELKPARIMGQIYLRLLEKIEKENFPVIKKKITLNLWQKAAATIKEIKA